MSGRVRGINWEALRKGGGEGWKGGGRDYQSSSLCLGNDPSGQMDMHRKFTVTLYSTVEERRVM